jgi:Kdo2-lipid IVA lauroyltransferase/acyltransferase
MYYFLRFLSLLPFWAIYGLSNVLFVLSYYVFRYRIGVVQLQIRNAFPDLADGELNTLKKRFYRNLCDMALETVKAYSLSKEQLINRVHFEGISEFNARNPASESTLFLTAHIGNWEWMFLAYCAHFGKPCDPIYKPLKNKGVNRFMLELRSKFGAVPIPKDSVSRELVKRRNSPRDIAMVADQLPVKSTAKYWTTFLGLDTAFYTGPGQIASLGNYKPCFLPCIEYAGAIILPVPNGLIRLKMLRIR